MALIRKPTKIYIMLSGGVDSSVAAALLKERGFDPVSGRNVFADSPDSRLRELASRGADVRGVHIKMWSDPSVPCMFKDDRLAAMRAAAHLGLPFETWDLTREYKAAVVEYMIGEYAAGRTPNPDVMCNSYIKFGIFLARALESGADFIASGHYARSQISSGSTIKDVKNSDTARYKLKIARDGNKDQSYFLWKLTQEQLKHSLFPIGDYTKPEVREMARVIGLPNAQKPDSQGICFIGEIDLKEFLQRSIPIARGVVKTTSGKTLGEHDGLAFYTIGQREGLGFGGGIPYYVAEKETETNTLIVAEGPYDEGLFRSELAVKGVNWISGASPETFFRCAARIRYRQPLQQCVIQSGIRNGGLAAPSLKVIFIEAQRAVTPGQSVVFYQDDDMLGGGMIV